MGKVYLVGAGTGNPQHLTLEAKLILERAEVLIYDALVDSAILQFVPPSCQCIDVGKRGGKVSTAQDRINQLLVYYCLQDKQVVRLKSGDPLIFGRSNSEITALQSAGCPFTIIPGLSSALVAPLLAGIPLTDPFLSQGFSLFTAHDPSALNWSVIAQLETLVFLMGGSTLSQVVALLQENGKPKTTPIAIIKNAGRENQEIWQSTLEMIVQETANVRLSPCIIVIGQVVTLSSLFISSKMILTNKTILITRALEQSSLFTELLREQGATVIDFPALEITPPSSWNQLDQSIADIGSVNWLILTSANAVQFFMERLYFLGKDNRSLGHVKIAVVGKKTAKILESYHLKADFIPPNYIADSLVDNFPEVVFNQTFLFPRVETGGREVLVQQFTEKGGKVIEVPAYESACPQIIPEIAWTALSSGKVDLITFASSKTVKNFLQLMKNKLGENQSVMTLLEKVKFGSIGPQTSQACYDYLGRVDIEAQEYTLEGLTEAILHYYRI